jgi:hypothetical protein
MKFQVVTPAAIRLAPMAEHPDRWVWELRPGLRVILDEDGCVETDWVEGKDVIK